MDCKNEEEESLRRWRHKDDRLESHSLSDPIGKSIGVEVMSSLLKEHLSEYYVLEPGVHGVWFLKNLKLRFKTLKKSESFLDVDNIDIYCCAKYQ